MQLPFGPQIINPPIMTGPVPQVDLPSGFRPPGLMGGGAPGLPQQQSMGLGGIPTIPGMGGMGANKNPANKPPGMPGNNQYGVPDPEAMQSAYPGGPNSIDESGAIKPTGGSNFLDVVGRLFGSGGSGFSGPTAGFFP
jgi:hypothetical protein